MPIPHLTVAAIGWLHTVLKHFHVRDVRDVRDVFLFHNIYIYSRKIPMKSGIFARGGRRADEEGGGRMRRADVGFEIRPKGQRRTADMERLLIFVERPLIFMEQ